MGNPVFLRKLRAPVRLKPITKARLAIEELESRLTPSGGLDFSQGFASAAGLLTLNGSTSIVGTRLELTNGGFFEAGSAFSTSRIDVSHFTSNFSFQLSNARADGFTFAIEGLAPTALGQSGSGLGYGSALVGQTGGILSSLAFKFDLYNNQGEGFDSVGLYLNGAAPTYIGSIDLSSYGLDLHSGDVFNVAMSYDGTTLAVSLTDSVTNKSASFSFAIDIPTLIGGSAGYVGFTGGTGGLTAVQDVLTWVYTSTTVDPPAAPSNLTASALSGTQISLAWTDNSTTETGFKIERKTGATGVYSQIALVDANVTSFTDSGLANGTDYFYRVRATNSGGDSAYSNEADATTLSPPVSPSNAQAVAASPVEVDLNWVDNATNEDGYHIWRSTAGGAWTLLATLAANSTSYADKGLTPNTLEDYHIEAFNAAGASPYVDASATTQAVPAPTGLSAAAGNALVNLSWSLVSGANTYNLYRSTASGAEAGSVLVAGLTTTSYSDTAVVNGTTYFYQVTAVENGGESTLSNEASATPQVPAPPAPSGLAGMAGDAQVSLTWSASSGAVNYDLYRSTTAGGEGATPYLTGLISTSFTDTGLNDGVTYYYEVSAVNPGGQSGLSNEVSATPQVPPPAAPTSLAGKAGDKLVSLTWTASSGAVSYDLYRSTTPGGEGATPYLTGLTSTSFTDTGLNDGVTYYYEVSAVNPGGQSGLSNEASATPVAPSGLFTIHINFTSDSHTVPSGYLDDVGLIYGDRGNGLFYGWNQDNTAAARDRDSLRSPDELHDTFIHTQKSSDPNASWTIAVPNGVYKIHLLAGDPDFTDSHYKFNVNGVLALNGHPNWRTHWFDNTIVITVTNGHIVLSNAPGSRNNKIDAIDITQMPAGTRLSRTQRFDFSDGFTDVSSLSFTGSAKWGGSALQLTNGIRSEAGSVFTNQSVNIAQFATQFRFQILNPRADGITFTIQGLGPAALGLAGGGLGYGPDHSGAGGGIGQSVAIKFDLFNNQGEGKNSTGLYVNGAAPTNHAVNLNGTGVNLHSGHVFSVSISYVGHTLTVIITDTVTGARAVQTYSIDIPGIVGDTWGYMGFTGGTGALTATQRILSWKYSS